MKLGLMNALETFQRLMDKVLEGLHFARVYLNDVVIFPGSKEDRIEHLQVFIKRIAKAQLKLEIKKCSYMKERIELLGHGIDALGYFLTQRKSRRSRNFHSHKMPRTCAASLAPLDTTGVYL